MNDRLSPIEAIMWRVGQDATLRMTVGALVLLDRPPTAAALRAAQIAIWRDGRWRSPYYWAGFIMQGEWK